jgi:hypothetical protein
MPLVTYNVNRRSPAQMARKWPGAQWRFMFRSGTGALWANLIGKFQIYQANQDPTACMIWASNEAYMQTALTDADARAYWIDNFSYFEV